MIILYHNGDYENYHEFIDIGDLDVDLVLDALEEAWYELHDVTYCGSLIAKNIPRDGIEPNQTILVLRDTVEMIAQARLERKRQDAALALSKMKYGGEGHATSNELHAEHEPSDDPN